MRVQRITHGQTTIAYTIVDAAGGVVKSADGFLRPLTLGTARTYAYLLLDHLRWLESESLFVESVGMADLNRYMAAVGADRPGPIGGPWREGKDPYLPASLKSAAACLKAFYVHLGGLGVNEDVATRLQTDRLPSRAAQRRRLLGHLGGVEPANPLAPSSVIRRHPKLPPEGALEAYVAGLSCARDRMIVTWLAHGGFRVGELCSLHLSDLHLRQGAACGQCLTPHVHICHREGNPNDARVKIKVPWQFINGCISGGKIRRVSPAMIHTYFEYMTTEYPKDVDHGFLLISRSGTRSGRPLAPTGVRRMLGRTGESLGLGRVKPHAFRHEFGTQVLAASEGNAVIAKEAGGWSSAATLEQVYGHVDLHDPRLNTALSTVWKDMG